jgi:sugar lactone lactonase YvrE
VELDLLDAAAFSNGAFLVNLFQTLRQHQSIKQLRLHITCIFSDEKEAVLIDSLQKDKFLCHLRLSQSLISYELMLALTYTVEEYQSLTSLELYQNIIDENDIIRLQLLENGERLMHLIISQDTLSNIKINNKWKENATVPIGVHGYGNYCNQINDPRGLCIDDDQTIYVADSGNHRVIAWKYGNTYGQIVAGGISLENHNDRLHWPTNVIVDNQTDSLLICDRSNKRVVQWPHQNGETIILDIGCFGLIMDNEGFLYVSDVAKDEVRRWKIGEKEGTLNQLNYPYYIFVDEDQSVYVSDGLNHRVMKWTKGAKEGIVVAGGQGEGNRLNQLTHPRGIVVDQFGTLYVADSGNHRVMRWLKGTKEDEIIVGRNGQGDQLNQLNYPIDLLFDKEGSLYVVDGENNRILKFDLDLI